jgi:hypothetical protein
VPAIAFGDGLCSLLDAFRNNSVEIKIRLGAIQSLFSAFNKALEI